MKLKLARWGRVAVVGLMMTGALAACGSEAATDPGAGSQEPSPSEVSGFPVSVEADNGKVTLDERPEAIVSLSPTATEMLFAIGAGDQVVAVDDQSDFPDGVPTTDLSGFEPNVEAIASYEPDLVIYSTDPGDLGSSLEKLSIPAVQHNAVVDFDGMYEQIDELGQLTGHSDEAAELSGSIETEMEELSSSTADLTYFHELDPTLYTATSETFIGQIYSRFGLVNIADEAKGASSGYPQLSEEYLIDSDPDLIFLADSECCGQSAETVAERPGWDQVTAVANGNVVSIPDDIASRWGPRVVEFMRIVADAVERAAS